jgi:putative copper export protein
MDSPHLLRRYLRRAALFAAAAVAVNLLLLGLGTLAGGSFLVPPFAAGGAEVQVGVGPVVVATLLGLAVGFAVAAVLVARRAARAVRLAQLVGAVLAVLSIVGPLTADTDATTRVALALMHVVCGAAYVLALQPHAVRTAGAGTPARRGTARQAA